jgi:hypothetical protein
MQIAWHTSTVRAAHPMGITDIYIHSIYMHSFRTLTTLNLFKRISIGYETCGPTGNTTSPLCVHFMNFVQ